MHVWRQVIDECQNNADFIGLKIDFINAFNSIARSIFLSECLTPWSFSILLRIANLDFNVTEVPALSLNTWSMDGGSLFGKITDVLKA